MAEKKRHTLIHYLIVILLTILRCLPQVIFFLGLALLGYLLYFRLVSPLNIIVGVALMGTGLSMTLISLWEMWASLVSFDFNLTHCPYCRCSTDPKKILSQMNGRVGTGHTFWP